MDHNATLCDCVISDTPYPLLTVHTDDSVIHGGDTTLVYLPIDARKVRDFYCGDWYTVEGGVPTLILAVEKRFLTYYILSGLSIGFVLRHGVQRAYRVFRSIRQPDGAVVELGEVQHLTICQHSWEV